MTVFVLAWVVALWAIVGLAVDGGRAMAAKAAGETLALRAARQAASAVSVEQLRRGQVLVDPGTARAAAAAVLAESGSRWQGHLAVLQGGREVVVQVSARLPTDVLGFIGVPWLVVRATSAVTLGHGVAGLGGG
jgi:hypothetical protein